MNLILQKKPSAITDDMITATITIEDCERLGLGHEYIGEHTFSPRRWSGITGKLPVSIVAMKKAELKSRKEGNQPRDMRQIVGLEKVECKRGSFGKRNNKDIERLTPSAKFFIYGLKRSEL